jgi:hypothetical protein
MILRALRAVGLMDADATKYPDIVNVRCPEAGINDCAICLWINMLLIIDGTMVLEFDKVCVNQQPN